MRAQTSGEVLSGGSCKGNVGVEMSKILRRVLEKQGVMVGCVLEEPSRNGLDDVIVRVGNIRELVAVKKLRFYKSREFLAILHGEITCTLRGSVCHPDCVVQQFTVSFISL